MDGTDLVEERLRSLRQELLQPVLMVIALAGLATLGATYLRIGILGWSMVTLAQLVAGCTMMTLYFVRNHLAYNLQLILLVVVLDVVAVVAQAGLGQAGVGTYVALLIVPMICTTFWSGVMGVLSFLLGLTATGIVASMWVGHHLHYQFDIAAYLQSSGSWITYLGFGAILAFFLVGTQWVLWGKLRQAFIQLQALNGELAHRASIDRMTNTWNRGHFLDMAQHSLHQAERYRQPLAILMLDLDHFKNINDRYGHAVGDEAIMALVRISQAVLRKSDFMGRMGGEEFAIALPNTTQEHAIVVAERVRQQVESFRLPLPEDPPLSMTVSLGMVMAEGDSLDRVLAQADAALYEAKRQGRNRLVVGHPQTNPTPSFAHE